MEVLGGWPQGRVHLTQDMYVRNAQSSRIKKNTFIFIYTITHREVLQCTKSWTFLHFLLQVFTKVTGQFRPIEWKEVVIETALSKVQLRLLFP